MNTNITSSRKHVQLPQLILALVALFFGAGALTAMAQSGSLSKDDVAFIKDAYQGGLYEVEVGKYAAEKGKADVVKQMGQKMVTDHTALNQKLADVAEKNGLTLDREPTAGTTLKIKTSTALSGEAFDKTYLPLSVRGHKKDIEAFRKEAESTSNADLKATIKEALPTLCKHLKEFQEAETTVSNMK